MVNSEAEVCITEVTIPEPTNVEISLSATSLHQISLDDVDDGQDHADDLLNPEKPARSTLTSQSAVDQTWSEWMQELPGSTWNKVSHFLACQWRWSKAVVSYSNLPDWLQDNKFLLSRHRLPIYSFAGCLFSAFRCHTETGNIWTHLIGSLATITLAIVCFSSRLHMLPWTEQLAYALFFTTASLCMGFSCMFHTVINHSPKVFKVFSRLDYSGISLLMVGSYVPWLYYSQFCYPLMYTVYTTSVCVIGVVGTIVTLWDEFDKPKYRTFRAAVFLTMGCSAVVPGIHYVAKFGWHAAVEDASLGWMILMGFFYVFGTTLYMLQVPERFFPGKCDLCFQSHQLMHMGVFIAVFICYHGISQLEFKHTEQRLNNTLCPNNILNVSWG